MNFPKTIKPKVGNLITLPKTKIEGYSLLNVGYKERFLVKSKNEREFNLYNYPFGINFFSYVQPQIISVYPHSSSYNHGQIISIYGYNFFKESNLGCVPICYFGSKIIAAKLISNTTMQCNAPVVDSSMIGKKLNLKFSFNGVDKIPKEFNFLFYKYKGKFF